jgi:transmembrane sensor
MDEAAIIRVLRGEATATEHRELSTWRRSAPENERLYQDVARLWRVTAVLEDDVRDRIHSPASEIIRREQARPVVGEVARPGRRRVPAFALAAAAVVLVALGIRAAIGDPSARPVPPAAATTEIVTGPDERVTVTLTDGSVVRLAPESHFRFVDGPGERRVELNGRAYFAVAKVDGKPFRIETPSGEATVLGTQFDLDGREGHFRLVVVQGRVAVAAADSAVEVGPRQMASMNAGAPPTVVAEEKVDTVTSWVGNFLVFQATPLRDALREIETRYGASIRLVDPELANDRVSAWFTDRDFPHVMTTICRILGARCEVGDRRAVVELR